MTLRPTPAADPQRLQRLLDALPSPLEPLDVVMLDGFLCGVLLQPQPLPAARWLPHVTDIDGRPARAGVVPQGLTDEVLRRAAELDQAIAARQWFDPWIYELAPPATVSDAVLPWVGGFSLAMDLFPAAAQVDPAALVGPLALLYRHFDPDDLDDDPLLREEIDSLEPPAHLADAVEELTRAVLLIADISRPQPMR